MCLQLEPSEEQVIVSSSGDRTASVWDRRKLSPGVKPLATATANNTILSAYFCPAGKLCYFSVPVWSGISNEIHENAISSTHVCWHWPSLPDRIGIRAWFRGVLPAAFVSAGTSSKDKKRSSNKATLAVNWSRAYQALLRWPAICAGNKTVLTTGRDNTLRLYNQDMSQLCSVPHNNNTGRWVMPLRATLGPSDTIVCGSMKRAVRLLSFTACDSALGSQRLVTCIKHRSSAQRRHCLRQREARVAPPD